MADSAVDGLSRERNRGFEKQLTQALGGSSFGRMVRAFERVSSTMEVAHALAADGAAEGTLVWAARQDQGRGRLGRTWESPKGGIYLSLILRPTRPTAETPQLSLVAGLAAAEAIQESTGLFPSIRWPNDLLLGRQKVGGILVEATSVRPPSTVHPPEPYVIVGIGINVTTQLKHIPRTATSLMAAGAECDPYQLTGELCRRFAAWYHAWSTKGFAPIREALRPWIGLFGQPVHVAAGSTEFEGTASDLDEGGRLVVRLDSGVLRPFDVGEVTLLR